MRQRWVSWAHMTSLENVSCIMLLPDAGVGAPTNCPCMHAAGSRRLGGPDIDSSAEVRIQGQPNVFALQVSTKFCMSQGCFVPPYLNTDRMGDTLSVISTASVFGRTSACGLIYASRTTGRQANQSSRNRSLLGPLEARKLVRKGCL